MDRSDYPDSLYKIVRLIAWASQTGPRDRGAKLRLEREVMENCVRLCENMGLDVSELRSLELMTRGVWISEEPELWDKVVPSDWDAALIHES